MGQYRVNISFAPAGGRRLTYGETVEIADADLGPYAPFIERRWMSRQDPGPWAPSTGTTSNTVSDPTFESPPEDDAGGTLPPVEDPSQGRVDDAIDRGRVEAAGPEVSGDGGEERGV